MNFHPAASIVWDGDAMYDLVVERRGIDVYVAWCVDMPEARAVGRTEDQAFRRAADELMEILTS
jgi:hypothetical protein